MSPGSATALLILDLGITTLQKPTPNVRFFLYALIRGLLFTSSFMHSFIITKTGISKADRILHNRTPLVILHFLEVSFQTCFLHFHYVVGHAACQCRRSPPSRQQGTTRVTLKGQRVFLARDSEISFINWG